MYVNFNSMTNDKMERCDKFRQAWEEKLGAEGPNFSLFHCFIWELIDDEVDIDLQYSMTDDEIKRYKKIGQA